VATLPAEACVRTVFYTTARTGDAGEKGKRSTALAAKVRVGFVGGTTIWAGGAGRRYILQYLINIGQRLAALLAEASTGAILKAALWTLHGCLLSGALIVYFP
jgi:hypothetical protein